jgi:hypothetical protein
MSVLSRLASKCFFLSLIGAVVGCCPCFAQNPDATVNPEPASQPLITRPVDEHQLTVLKGNTHPLARPQFDLGTAAATLPMQRMLLVLKRGPAQEFLLRKMLDDQQDRHSASYHKWLTPEQFGKQFGPTDGDMQIITAWLQSHGFQVGATKGRTVLEFSGSASQVQEAFHTTIHRYVVNGEEHWANSSDPSIPTALTPAVAGVLTLHNFLKKPQIRIVKQPVTAKIRPGKSPEITFTDGSHGMGPADFATIYNSSPLLNNALNPVNGTGVTIGVIGRSNLYSVDSPDEDVTDFYTELNAPGGALNVILNGPDPGDLGGSDEAEATLDTTWSGAVAPGATVDFVISASTNTSDGIDLSEVYIIENNLADIMTESFSFCEADGSAAQSLGYSQLAEQAAAQGITYFVSTGDNGAEGCDDQDTETVATGPVSVNVLAATAFNVAVGGTVFNDTADPAKYWSATNTNQESALSYIPENVWNDSCLASSCGSSANIVAGSGGSSIYVAKPSWQSGVTGILSDSSRDLPDVSLNADTHDGYVLCLDGSCVPNSQGEFLLYVVGGTSASAPSFAGIMALVDQKNMPNRGGAWRQGLANYILYKLAASENASLPACNASNTTNLPASTCTFNDVTIGNNSVPGEVGYGTPSAQYQAGTGYDMASGLGSVNINNLVNNWSTISFAASTTTLTVTPSSPSTIVHGQPATVNVTVTPTVTTGTPPTPTGDVSLLAVTSSDPIGMSLQYFTLSSGAVSNALVSNLPGGSYPVIANYAGDANYGGSGSSFVMVTVTPEPSTTTLSVLSFNSSGQQFNFAGGPFGSFVYLRADVAGLSGHGTPTGSINFTDTFGTIPGGSPSGLSLALNSGDSFQGGAYTATPNGILNFDAGTHKISASYPGDNSFNASSSSPPISFTITPGFFATTGNVAPTVLISAPGGTGSTSVSVASSTGFSGTINLACSGLPAGAACTFSPASIKATGTLTSSSSAINITTTAPSAGALRFPARRRLDPWLALSGLMLFSIVLIGVPGRRRLPILMLLLGLMILLPGCGGGGSKTTTPPPPPVVTPTPAGSYNITVSATSGSTSYETGFTLVVE